MAQATNFLIAPFGIIQRTDYGEALFSRARLRIVPTTRVRTVPMGIIQLHTSALPARYVQSPSQLVILYELNMERREIFFDGRPLPSADVQPWWNGYFVGRGEGDALMVQTTNFRAGGWPDMSGNLLTDAATVTERIRRPAWTHGDRHHHRGPQGLRAPPQGALEPATRAGYELIEFVCAENNKFPRFR